MLHELADDVVYSGNMVGVERMPQAEQIRKASDAEQRRPIGEGDPYPDPGCGIAAQQHTIGHRCLGPGKGRPIVERVRQHERVLLATRHAGMGPNGAPRLARAALNSASGYPIPRAEFHAEGIDPVEWCGAGAASTVVVSPGSPATFEAARVRRQLHRTVKAAASRNQTAPSSKTLKRQGPRSMYRPLSTRSLPSRR